MVNLVPRFYTLCTIFIKNSALCKKGGTQMKVRYMHCMKDNKWYNLEDKEKIENIECNGDCANCEHYNIEWVEED